MNILGLTTGRANTASQRPTQRGLDRLLLHPGAAVEAAKWWRPSSVVVALEGMKTAWLALFKPLENHRKMVV